jgi:hypothetical protein
MSEEKSVKLECPHCGKEIELPVYTSINRQTNPELAEKVMDGSLFMPPCPECGETIPAFYPTLYNDMVNKLMVHLVGGEDEIEDVVTAITEVKNAYSDMGEIGEAMKDVHWRIVTDPFALQEKAYIFDAGLNDRPVEFLKSAIYIQLKDELTDPRSRVMFSRLDDDGNLTFEAFDGERVAVVTAPKELYDKMAALKEADITPENYVVDEAWAAGVLAE